MKLPRPYLPFAAIGFALSIAAFAQEPKPALLNPSNFEPAVELTLAWRAHGGDDARWADPRFDDRGWLITDPRLPDGKLGRLEWPGVAWFRRHLNIRPSLADRQFALYVSSIGTARVYLDGALLAETAGRTAGPWFFSFSGPGEHVLAVRYQLDDAARFRILEMNPGFVISLGPAMPVVRSRLLEGRRNALLEGSFLTVAGVLALLHLAFYWFYPRSRENLFYACVMGFFAVVAWCDFESGDARFQVLISRALIPSVIAVIFFTLLTYYSVRCSRLPRAWLAFFSAALVLGIGSFATPLFFDPWAWPLFFAAMLLEVYRVERSGSTVRREGTGLLLTALLTNAIFIVLQLLISLHLVGPIGGISSMYLFGMLAFGIGMSLFLAKNFGLTTLESQRTASELEQARALQLSMLPRRIPQVEGLEIAVCMTTASEVGGDYYDFRIASDGALVVAVGDATGHGAAAGTMVTAVKALFTALGDDVSPTRVLEGSNRALRDMTVSLRMCLAVARVTPRSVSFVSAAMPPLLLFRRATGDVLELGSGGLPLGGPLSGRYVEETAALSPGDALLFATDGLAEMLDESDAHLGFERAADEFRRAAGGSAEEMVQRLVRAVDLWRGSREQADDMTLVAVRVTG